MFQLKPGLRGLLVITTALFPPLSLASCDAEKPQNHDRLQEIIDVNGTCTVEQTGSSDKQKALGKFAGKIYRWQAVETKTIYAYGVLFGTDNSTEQPEDQSSARGSLQKVSFSKIDIDTDQPRWTLHGVSNHRHRGDAAEQPLNADDTTCQIEVFNRSIGSTESHKQTVR